MTKQNDQTTAASRKLVPEAAKIPSYFAYGADMDGDHLQMRGFLICGSQPARLRGFSLRFNRPAYGNPRRAWANIEEDANGVVEGILYSAISWECFKNLDQFEGYPQDCDKRQVLVEVQGGPPIEAVTYLVPPVKTHEGLIPGQGYIDCMLTRKEGLSAACAARLESLSTMPENPSCKTSWLAAVVELLSLPGFVHLSEAEQNRRFDDMIARRQMPNKPIDPADCSALNRELWSAVSRPGAQVSQCIDSYIYGLRMGALPRGRDWEYRLQSTGKTHYWVADNRSTVCIMADFGMSPYAWEREPGNPPPAVGGCIAEGGGWFSEDFKANVPAQLKKELSAWAIAFEIAYDKVTFDWAGWNERGIALATELKRLVGDIYRVEYHYPCEDPLPEHHHLVLEIDQSGKAG